MKGIYFFAIITFLFSCVNAYSQTASDTIPDITKPANELELANTLQNPIAHLINLQYQNNFEFKVGPQNAFRYTLNFQPLIPFHLGEKWSIITRSIVPVISQIGMSNPTGKTGISDFVLNTYLSPKNIPFVLGIGPSVQFPVASSSAFGARKWAGGVTIAFLKQFGSFRIAAVPHHLWSNKDDRTGKKINFTFIRSYITYLNKSRTTLGVFSEVIRDWSAGSWNVGITPTIGQLTKLVNQYVDLSIGVKYYVVAPEQAPQWGIRVTVIEVIPTKALTKMMVK
jgi:hypothetical protein